MNNNNRKQKNPIRRVIRAPVMLALILTLALAVALSRYGLSRPPVDVVLSLPAETEPLPEEEPAAPSVLPGEPPEPSEDYEPDDVPLIIPGLPVDNPVGEPDGENAGSADAVEEDAPTGENNDVINETDDDNGESGTHEEKTPYDETNGELSAADTILLMFEALSETDYENSEYTAHIQKEEYEAKKAAYKSAYNLLTSEFVYNYGIRGFHADALADAMNEAMRVTPVYSVTVSPAEDSDSVNVTITSGAIDLAVIRQKVLAHLFALPPEEAYALVMGGEEALGEAAFPLFVQEIKTADRTRTTTVIKLVKTENIWQYTPSDDILPVFMLNTDALYLSF